MSLFGFQRLMGRGIGETRHPSRARSLGEGKLAYWYGAGFGGRIVPRKTRIIWCSHCEDAHPSPRCNRYRCLHLFRAGKLDQERIPTSWADWLDGADWRSPAARLARLECGQRATEQGEDGD